MAGGRISAGAPTVHRSPQRPGSLTDVRVDPAPTFHRTSSMPLFDHGRTSKVACRPIEGAGISDVPAPRKHCRDTKPGDSSGGFTDRFLIDQPLVEDLAASAVQGCVLIRRLDALPLLRPIYEASREISGVFQPVFEDFFLAASVDATGEAEVYCGDAGGADQAAAVCIRSAGQGCANTLDPLTTTDCLGVDHG